jgi:hypothetical protein
VKACRKNPEGTVTQIWTAPNEQGYGYRQHGVLDHTLMDFEGLALVTRFRKEKKRDVAESNNKQ